MLHWESGTFPNGIPLHVVTDRSLPFVTCAIVVRGGSRLDGRLPGVTDITASLLSYGAGERDALRFAHDVEYLGADVSADAGADSVVIDLETLRRSLDEGVDLLTDMVLLPRFEPEDIERERAQRLAGLMSAHSDPDWRADAALRESVMAGTDYAHPTEGTPSSVVKVDRQEILSVHQRLLSSELFVVATGDVDIEELGRLLAPGIGSLPDAPPPPTGSIDEVEQPPPSLTLINRPGSAHTALRLGRRGVRRGDPDYLPLRVLTTILGDYFNSRLNSRLREDLGYTYGAWATLEGKQNAGLLSIGTSVRGDRVGETIRTIREEIETLATRPVEREELEMVARYMAGRQAMAQETPEQIGEMVGTIELYDLGRDYYQRVVEEIRELTPDVLQEVAARTFRAEEFTIVAAGEQHRFEEALREFGDPTIVDE